MKANMSQYKVYVYVVHRQGLAPKLLLDSHHPEKDYTGGYEILHTVESDSVWRAYFQAQRYTESFQFLWKHPMLWLRVHLDLWW